MDFFEVLSFIIVLVLWVCFSVVLLAIYLCYGHEIDYWDKVYDNCNSRNAKYVYVVRMVFGSFKKGFNISKTTVSIEVRTVDPSKPALTRFQITPKQMEQSFNNSDQTSSQKVVKFLLYRREPLTNMSYVQINHNGFGTINVSNVEIQDIDSFEANIAYVGKSISSLPEDKCRRVQIFPGAGREERGVEASLKPPKTITFTEFVVFAFLSVDIILLMCVLIIPCNQNDTNFCDDYKDGFLSSLFAGLVSSTIAAFIFIFVIVIYRYFIKKFNTGKGFRNYIKNAYLLIVIFVGVIFGCYAAYLCSGNRKFPKEMKNQNFNHESFWMFGIGTGIILFFLFWVSLLSFIGYLIGFFGKVVDKRIGSQLGKGMISETDYPTLRTNPSKEEEDSQNYYNSLMSGNTKVKSISQYKGVQNQPKPPEKSKALSASSKVPKTKSNESTGSGYFAELMSKGQGKVKSVSQYRGVGKQ
jgi:hypothetical protein